MYLGANQATSQHLNQWLLCKVSELWQWNSHILVLSQWYGLFWYEIYSFWKRQQSFPSTTCIWKSLLWKITPTIHERHWFFAVPHRMHPLTLAVVPCQMNPPCRWQHGTRHNTENKEIWFNSLAPEGAEVNSNYWFSNSYSSQISWAFSVKLPSYECHMT